MELCKRQRSASLLYNIYRAYLTYVIELLSACFMAIYCLFSNSSLSVLILLYCSLLYIETMFKLLPLLLLLFVFVGCNVSFLLSMPLFVYF